MVNIIPAGVVIAVLFKMLAISGQHGRNLLIQKAKIKDIYTITVFGCPFIGIVKYHTQNNKPCIHV